MPVWRTMMLFATGYRWQTRLHLMAELISQGDDTRHRTQGSLGARCLHAGLKSFEALLKLNTQEVKINQ